jgi:NADPH-dependent curcumin reductase CurA
MAEVSREIRLAARPSGVPRESDFELVEAPVPEPGDGQLLVRNAYISVDPYMRPRMNDVPSYVPPFRIGKALDGGAVGRVVASRNRAFAEGDWVTHGFGWREWALIDGRGVRKVSAGAVPISAYLGALGMPGLTAYVGLFDIGRVKEGETVFVSGAAGAVGSAAGQMAKIAGCTVIGSAGSEEKVAWLRELGFDVAFDYRQTPVREALRAAAPDGIDVYFDNVAGDHLQAALSALRTFGRIVACGSISRYNDERAEPGPANLHYVVTKRLRMEGFIVADRADRAHDFMRDAAEWAADGRLRWRETIVEGIENAPSAFLGLLTGENIGKMLVKVGPDDRGGTGRSSV